MLAAGVRRGQAVNVMGSTDVLAVCTDQPTPDARVLTRPLGTGRWWVQVATLASAATTLKWLRQTLFAEMDEPRFAAHVRRASRRDPGAVTFVPRLAGDRHSIEPSVASFSGLTLSTTREDLLAAAVDALARASAERWDVLRSLGVRPSGPILLSGGLSGTFRRVLHRDWPAGLRFRQMHEATLRGVAMLSDRSPRS
jgi:xylulokinase